MISCYNRGKQQFVVQFCPMGASINNKTYKVVVSVIMPCYSTAKYLPEAIESILKQTFKEIELIIIDDASKDSSLKIIQKYQDLDHRIKVIKNDYNKGISACMNIGLKHAIGKYITRMDSDDISLPQRIEKQVALLNSHKEFGLCSVDMSSIDKNGILLDKSWYPKTETPLSWMFLWANPIANAPTMYRADIIKNLSFNNKLAIAEDYDLLCRIILNTKACQINEALYIYRIHSKSIIQKRMEESLLNAIKISRKLAEELTSETPPKLHGYLTKYARLLAQNDTTYSVFEITNWMDKLLLNGKKKWKWTDPEYQLARIDANNRIKEYILSQKLCQYKFKCINDLTNELESEKNSNVALTREIKNLNDSIENSRALRLSKRIKNILKHSGIIKL